MSAQSPSPWTFLTNRPWQAVAGRGSWRHFCLGNNHFCLGNDHFCLGNEARSLKFSSHRFSLRPAAQDPDTLRHDPRSGPRTRVTHGALAAPAPWCGSLGSPGTCTEVHPGRLAPYCTVHLGASGLLCTCTKVHPGRLAPYCTVHLGASGL